MKARSVETQYILMTLYDVRGGWYPLKALKEDAMKQIPPGEAIRVYDQLEQKYRDSIDKQERSRPPLQNSEKVHSGRLNRVNGALRYLLTAKRIEMEGPNQSTKIEPGDTRRLRMTPEFFVIFRAELLREGVITLDPDEQGEISASSIAGITQEQLDAFVAEIEKVQQRNLDRILTVLDRWLAASRRELDARLASMVKEINLSYVDMQSAVQKDVTELEKRVIAWLEAAN